MFWSFWVKHLLVGLLLVIAGYAVWTGERAKPEEQRRQWAQLAGLVLMLAGVVFGMGVGTSQLIDAIVEQQ
jgi:uncharacterized membrane protein HdeD (DUF308 family)